MRSWSWCGALVVALLFLTSGDRAVAQTNTSWSSAVSGDWFNASRWSPTIVPNNGTPNPGDTYNATIGATGGSYTISLASPITINRLSLASAGATLDHTSGTLTLLNASTISSGTYRLDGGAIAGAGTLAVTGGSFVWNTGTMSGAGATVVSSAASLLIAPPQGIGPVLARPLENFGTATIGGGTLTLQAATFLNAGLINVNATQIISGGVLHNDGTINVGSTTWLAMTSSLRGAGTINNVAGGRVDLFDTQTSGGRLVGAGAYNLGGTHVPAGTWTFAADDVNLGTTGFGGESARFDGAGTIAVASGTFHWFSGTMAGAGVTRVGPGAFADLPGQSTAPTRTLARLLESEGSMVIARGTLTMNAGTLANLAGGRLRFSAEHDIVPLGAATASLVRNAGTMEVNANSVRVSVPVQNDGNLSVAFPGRLFMQAPLDGTGETHLTSELRASRIRQRALTINQGVASIHASNTDASTSRLEQLTISGSPGNWTSQLDLRDNDLVIDYAAGDPSPITTIADQLRGGYNDGSWNGTGIRTSLGSSTRALGFAEAGDIFTSFPAMFSGQSVDDSAVLIRYTRYGDANLNGVVTLQDFNRLASSFGETGAVWSDGDFNYDGLVSLQDFNRLAANFGLSAAGPDVTPADWASLASVVPEPVCLPLFVSVASAAMWRRSAHRRIRRDLVK